MAVLDQKATISGSLPASTRWPGGAQFAFSILDDTDDATVANVGPIYQLLRTLGFRTTKTVWAVDCSREEAGVFFAGHTLADPAYLDFVRTLVADGFELASHGATKATSRRERTEKALDLLREEFGSVPALYCNHGQNLENLYWGPARYRSRLLRWPIALASQLTGRPDFQGDRPGSPYFWGDLCRAHFRYVRSFAFRKVNGLRIGPGRPYRLPDTPWVQHWFCTSDAPDVGAFNRLLTRQAIDMLAAEQGVCIVSTHLGKGFVRNGRVDPQVEDTLRYLATLRAWRAPVTEILDHLRPPEGEDTLSWLGRLQLELRHVVDRLRVAAA